MGYYLEFAEHNKAHALATTKGVKEVSVHEAKQYVPNVVCCVYNPGQGFWAAGWCYSKREYNEFSDPYDRRQKRWFWVPDEIITATYPKQFELAKKGEL